LNPKQGPLQNFCQQFPELIKGIRINVELLHSKMALLNDAIISTEQFNNIRSAKLLK